MISCPTLFHLFHYRVLNDFEEGGGGPHHTRTSYEHPTCEPSIPKNTKKSKHSPELQHLPSGNPSFASYDKKIHTSFFSHPPLPAPPPTTSSPTILFQILEEWKDWKVAGVCHGDWPLVGKADRVRVESRVHARRGLFDQGRNISERAATDGNEIRKVLGKEWS